MLWSCSLPKEPFIVRDAEGQASEETDLEKGTQVLQSNSDFVMDVFNKQVYSWSSFIWFSLLLSLFLHYWNLVFFLLQLPFEFQLSYLLFLLFFEYRFKRLRYKWISSLDFLLTWRYIQSLHFTSFWVRMNLIAIKLLQTLLKDANEESKSATNTSEIKGKFFLELLAKRVVELWPTN